MNNNIYGTADVLALSEDIFWQIMKLSKEESEKLSEDPYYNPWEADTECLPEY